MVETLEHHKSYQQAACGAVRCYIDLFDKPEDNASDEPDLSKMSAAERKKYKQKARKAAKKAESQQAKSELAPAAEDQSANDDGKKKRPQAPVDEDPNGDKLLNCDPLVEASRLVASLNEFSPDAITTRVVAYDVAVRRRKPLQALRAIIGGRNISPTDPQFFFRFLQFVAVLTNTPTHPLLGSTVDHAKATLEVLSDGPAKEAFDAEVELLLQGKTPSNFLDEFNANPLVQTSLPHALGAAKCQLLLNASNPSSTLLAGGLDRLGANALACEEVHEFLKEVVKDDAAAANWFTLCAARFPKSKAFGTPITIEPLEEAKSSGEISSGDC